MDDGASRPARPTMADVGRLANVSAMTVSRTLAGHPVSPAVRQRVLSAVEQLDYVPDASAGALSSGRSAFVAALVPTLNNSNFADTASGLTDALAGTGLQLLLGYTEYSTEREAALVRAMLRHRPAAIVLTGGDHANDTRQALSRATLPVVETWDAPERPLGHVVGFSNAAAAELMVQHLAGRGYRRIAFLGGRSGADRRGADRERGFARAIATLGLGPPRVIRHGMPPLSMEHGAKAVVKMLDRWPDTQAVFCVSDMSAFGALMELRRRGYEVPGGMAVAGFGNFEVSRWCSPRITTVTLDAYGLGRQAGRVVLDALQARRRGEPPGPPQHWPIEFAIDAREST